jgi:aldehyde:ferredoxin oxidoreductase
MKADGQAAASRIIQIAMAAVDCTGLCLVASFELTRAEGDQAFLTAMNATFGTAFGSDSIPQMGTKVLQEEREFNREDGFNSNNDRLPDFFLQRSPARRTPTCFFSQEKNWTRPSVFGRLVRAIYREALHRELVAFGTIAQSVMENYSKNEIKEVIDFCWTVGLPITLEQLGIKDTSGENFLKAADPFARRIHYENESSRLKRI